MRQVGVKPDIDAAPDAEQAGSNLHFLTSHANALLCIHRDPELRVRDLAETIGITERRAQGIISDLVEAGYLMKERVGRRNRYTVKAEMPLPSPMLGRHRVEDILALADAAPGADAQEDAGDEDRRLPTGRRRGTRPALPWSRLAG